MVAELNIRLSGSWLKIFYIFLLSWIYSWEKSNVHTWQHPDLDSTYISSCEHTGSTTLSNRYIPTCVSRILVNHAQYSNYLMNTRIEYSTECSLSFLSTIFSKCLCSCNSLHGISQWRSILCANELHAHILCTCYLSLCQQNVSIPYYLWLHITHCHRAISWSISEVQLFTANWLTHNISTLYVFWSFCICIANLIRNPV